MYWNEFDFLWRFEAHALKNQQMQNVFLLAQLKLILKNFFYSGYSVTPSDISPSFY